MRAREETASRGLNRRELGGMACRAEGTGDWREECECEVWRRANFDDLTCRRVPPSYSNRLLLFYSSTLLLLLSPFTHIVSRPQPQ